MYLANFCMKKKHNFKPTDLQFLIININSINNNINYIFLFTKLSVLLRHKNNK